MVVEVKNTTVIAASGEAKKLGEYSENVILVVNVASYCGNTAQYEDLQKLHNKYSKKGLIILAFPIRLLSLPSRIFLYISCLLNFSIDFLSFKLSCS